MRASILDQSPIISGHTAADAIAATLDLAQATEEPGYARFWLAEHHGLLSLADPCPEILLARIGSLTRKIRMLEALFPGRIDQGLGRAPGGDMQTARALTGSTTEAVV